MTAGIAASCCAGTGRPGSAFCRWGVGGGVLADQRTTSRESSPPHGWISSGLKAIVPLPASQSTEKEMPADQSFGGISAFTHTQ